jgi:hypothetical protein
MTDINNNTGLPDYNPKQVLQRLATRGYAATQRDWQYDSTDVSAQEFDAVPSIGQQDFVEVKIFQAKFPVGITASRRERVMECLRDTATGTSFSGLQQTPLKCASGYPDDLLTIKGTVLELPYSV